MLSKDFLSEIMRAERAAQDIYDEALRAQADFDGDLTAKVEALRKQFYAKSDTEIAEFEKAATAETEKALAALQKELETELAQVRTIYESRRESIVEYLFDQVVGGDD